MSLIIFLIILSALIIVHELGHFGVAKKFGIRVDEFGLGYPPKAKKLFSWKGTDFTLNWLPFGGFVKIFGENPEVNLNLETRFPSDSFQSKNRGIQGAVLVAGVVCNFLFAWLLISLGFMTGLPAPAGLDLPLTDTRTVVTIVIPGSPAYAAGIKSGDTLLSLSRKEEIVQVESPEVISEFISRSSEPIDFEIKRGEDISTYTITPGAGILANRPAIGISMEVLGTVKLPVHKALWQGWRITVDLTVVTAKAIGNLLKEAVMGKADLTAVTGPVGIVSMVGDMRELGLSYLVMFTALLSINLAIINLMPFPALDGGRLLFVIIETITRRPIPARFFNALNALGFGLLIFLMVLITIQDVRNIL